MEQRQFESPQPGFRPRKKFGLETPLHGRFVRERYLVFSPSRWYDLLVGACVVGGFGFAVTEIFTGIGFQWGPLPFSPAFFGAIFVAGVWGALSSERMVCDLRQRTYTRLEGQGLKIGLTRGKLDEIDAVVLQSQESYLPSTIGRHVTYRLVVFWKGQRHPLLIVERRDRSIPGNAPINHGAGDLFQKGQAFARALGVQFYDNSHFSSPAPLPVA